MRPDLSSYRAGITVAFLLVCVVVTVTCLYFSIFTVFPHLYYLPIVLVAYWYPRQGIAFSVGAAVIYAGLVLLFAPLDAPVMISTALRCIVFVGIGTLVTLLTVRLQRGEERYRGIAEHTGVGTLILDRDQIIRYANREANRILGTGDARGRSWMECVAPGERERVRGYHQSR
ncbi:MAG: PAS domain S-box protein [Methanomicrobiales archaeon]